MKYHLAQVNVAYAKAGSETSMMRPYLERLDEINAQAERSPGFVWRFVTDSRDPLDRIYPNPLILFNFSVWESIEALHNYTYKTVHAAVYAGRRQWFSEWKDMPGAASGIGYFAMWWIRAGQLPTLEEAKAKLRRLAERGPTPLAFHFKTRFTPEESEAYERSAERL